MWRLLIDYKLEQFFILNIFCSQAGLLVTCVIVFGLLPVHFNYCLWTKKLSGSIDYFLLSYSSL